MRKFMYVAFVAALALFGLTFSYRNYQTVRLDYYFGVDFTVHLPLLLLITFALGLALGCLATWPRVWRARRRRANAGRESRALQRAGDS